MNIAGAKKSPFLFGFDYELEKGFFIEDPLNQETIFWRIGNKGNYKKLKTNDKGSFFRSIPISKEAYNKKIAYILEEQKKGNSFLLNLTIKTPIETDFSFEEIFSKSNAPYNLLIPNKLVCFSPEIFIKIEKNIVSSYPMKGTIDGDIDNAENIILNDYKESAEHYTIVDFIRNDLSRISTNIDVEKLRYIDRLKTSKGDILQVSSKICGKLDPQWNEKIGDLIYELLPAGSISGAPKESSLNIIRNAEQQKRGYYTGVFGYFDGETLDSAVMIRFIENDKDKLFFRSGGGVTINSDPTKEYEEVIEKAYLPFNK
ncbi:MAG: aminodeoxychorismate synthase component I [Bacteroidetes bacterium]|nr:aminodeoxychorismate synthase component I [Bacteroidota bacterium]